jgi:hypothetical protein
MIFTMITFTFEQSIKEKWPSWDKTMLLNMSTQIIINIRMLSRGALNKLQAPTTIELKINNVETNHMYDNYLICKTDSVNVCD